MPGIGAQRGSGRGVRRRNSTITAATAPSRREHRPARQAAVARPRAARPRGRPPKAAPPEAPGRCAVRAGRSPGAPPRRRTPRRRTAPVDRAAAPGRHWPRRPCPTPTGRGGVHQAQARADITSAGRRQHAPPAQSAQDRALDQASAQRRDSRVDRGRGQRAEHGRESGHGGPRQRGGDEDRRALKAPRTSASPGRPPTEMAVTAAAQPQRASELGQPGAARGAERPCSPVPRSGTARASSRPGRPARARGEARSSEGRARAPDRGTRRRMTELAGKVGAVARERGSGPPISRAVCAGVSRRHGVGARPALVQAEGERVDVGGLAHALAFGLLGRHVGERPDHLAGGGQRVAAVERGDPEVHQLGAAPGAGVDLHDHVLRLHVTVDHAAGVGVGQRIADVRPEPRYLPIREIAAFGELGEGGAVHQLADQKGAPLASDPSSYRVTMPGWLRRAAACASRRIRRASVPAISFTATWRWRRSSKARYTTPMPPEPTRSRTRNRSITRSPTISDFCFAAKGPSLPGDRNGSCAACPGGRDAPGAGVILSALKAPNGA